MSNSIVNSIRFLRLDIGQIQEVAQAAADRRDQEGDMVLDAALMELELRMPEADFLEYIKLFEL